MINTTKSSMSVKALQRLFIARGSSFHGVVARYGIEVFINDSSGVIKSKSIRILPLTPRT